MQQKVGVLIFIIAILGIAYWISLPWLEFSPSSRFGDLSSEHGATGQRNVVELKIEAIEPTSEKVTGNAAVALLMRAIPDRLWEGAKNAESVQLILRDSQTPNEFSVGGGQIPLIHLPQEELVGSGSFRWSLETLSSEFFYPFDRYRLNVNNTLGVPSEDAGIISVFSVENFSVNMQIPNLYMEINAIENHERGKNSHEIILRRSGFSQFLTIIVGVMAIFIVINNITNVKYETLVGQSVAFLVGLWGARTILLGGVKTSDPIAIDWVIIGLYIIVAFQILYRWRVVPSVATTHCQYCQQKIDCKATFCPFCTQENPIKDPSKSGCPELVTQE